MYTDESLTVYFICFCHFYEIRIVGPYNVQSRHQQLNVTLTNKNVSHFFELFRAQVTNANTKENPITWPYTIVIRNHGGIFSKFTFL